MEAEAALGEEGERSCSGAMRRWEMASGKGTGSGLGCSRGSASEIRPVASGCFSPGTSASREKIERWSLLTQ